ncbi:MAG TPA: alpha/beta hydrolase-fold protein [Mucilaginibacter sp.]|nr:alpha/beta hydrolase-fold protein [Mucilaginibacter sp.]
MKKLIIFLFSISSLSAFAQKDNRITIGTVDTVYSNILGEKRAILVHVPKGDKAEKYPVLYILDGEEHFQSAVAIDEQMSGVTPPMIVVGITNTNRERDLTPTHMANSKESGGGENFIGFIERELMPYVESHYPTAPYRIFSGHSLGGLTVMNAFFNHTNLFNAYIALDPSLWWDGQRWIKRYEAELSGHNFNKKSLFIAIANNIPPGRDTISILKDTSVISPIPQSVIPFIHILRTAKPVGLRWTSKFYPNERHGTVELTSEYDALRYIFDYYQFRTSQFADHPELDEDSVIAAHYRIISEKLGYTVQPTEDLINNMAYDCMSRKKWDVAYKLFKRNTDNHPESSNAFDSLGDYYVERGDKPNAIAVFTKALRLNETADTRRKLNELKR